MPEKVISVILLHADEVIATVTQFDNSVASRFGATVMHCTDIELLFSRSRWGNNTHTRAQPTVHTYACIGLCIGMSISVHNAYIIHASGANKHYIFAVIGSRVQTYILKLASFRL